MRAIWVGLAVALTGCASPMVRSYPADRAGDASGEYLGDYGLATSRLRVKVTARGGDGAGADGGKSSAASVNFNSSITVTTSGEQKAEASSGKAEGSICPDIRKTYNLDREAGLRLIKHHADFRVQIDKWLAVAPEGDDNKAAVKTVDAFLRQRAEDRGGLLRAMALAPLVADCPQPIQIELIEALEVGPIYRLYANRAWMADNVITAEFDNGYVKSINATADDRTADIVVEGAKSIASIATLGRRIPSADFESMLVSRAGAEEDGLLDLISPLRRGAFSADALNKVKAHLTKEMEQAARAMSLLAPIDAPLPLQKTFELSQLATPQAVDKRLGDVLLKADCTAPGAASPVGGVDAKGRAQTGAAKSYYDGVLAPSTRSCVVSAMREGVEVGRAAFAAADASRPQLLSTPRQMFVKQSSNYGFSDGRLVKVETSRPNPVLSFVSLPFRAIGGVTQVVSDGVRGRKGVIEAETEMLKAETARIEAARALEAAKAPKADGNDGT